MQCRSLLLLPLLLPAVGLGAISNGFKVPDGFEVSVFATDEMAHDIFSLTTDSQGRIVVAGRGYVRVLEDRNRDGVADSAAEFAQGPKSGARGMYFEGTDLIATGDKGLRIYRDANGDGRADGEGEKIFPVKSDGEHTANGLVKGPDGWFYVICGNDAGIGHEHATGPGSPIRTNVMAGALVRVSPDLKQSEVVAHGFRNPYDLDFDARGMLFTYDSDGERDHYLPWYAGSRVFDIATGMEHGWILNGWGHSWSRPESNFDNVPRAFEVGRGSPTGVTVYQHHQFPRRYRNGLFAICWSFGRVYFFPLNRSGATVTTDLEIFMESATEAGFAPVDAVVGPQGDLFVAVGGRGTMGAVYRVRYTKSESYDPIGLGVDAVVNAPQPLSNWSRSKWQPLARNLEPRQFELMAKSPVGSRKSRLRAVEILVEIHGGVSVQLARDLVERGEKEVAARAVWGLGRSPDSAARRKALCDFTSNGDVRIARAAWEALINLPSPLSAGEGNPNFIAGFESEDRRVRSAAVVAAKGPLSEAYRRMSVPRRLGQRARLGMAMVGKTGDDTAFHGINTALYVFSRSRDLSSRIDAVRLLQKELGDVLLVPGTTDTHDGFVATDVDEVPTDVRHRIVERLGAAFPSGSDELDREAGRVLAMLTANSPGLMSRVSDKWTVSSRPEDDIHYLQIAARLTEQRDSRTRGRIARALVQLQHKMLRLKRTASRHWPKHVAQTFGRLLERDEGLANAIIAAEGFGLAEHSMLARRMKTDEQKRAAAVALVKADKWTPDLVSFATVLEPEVLFPLLRTKWDEIVLRDAIVRALARQPGEEDRAKFLSGLLSFDNGTVVAAARALTKLSDAPSPDDVDFVVKVLRRLTSDRKKKAPRAEMAKLLQAWSGEDIALAEEGEDILKVYQPWFDWYAKTYDRAGSISLTADEDLGTFLERLKAISWETGNPVRGKVVFEERQCHTCHASQTRVGPHLNEITKRFSVEDLFIAIVDPDRDISAAYFPRIYDTKAGVSYTGFPVYDSPAATIVQTGPSTTVRFTSDDIVSVRYSQTSLMPGGLLAGLNDEQLADFYAYMKSLK